MAANLRRIRRERDLTTAALSRRLAEIGHPIADTGITKIEKGDRRVDVDDLVALAVALDTTPNRLLLHEMDAAHPSAEFDLTPRGTRSRLDDAWAWASGERPFAREPASPPESVALVLSPDRLAQAQPYVSAIFLQLRDLAINGIAEPSGEQIFPDSPHDAKTWDLHRADLSDDELVWLIAALHTRSAARATAEEERSAYDASA